MKIAIIAAMEPEINYYMDKIIDLRLEHIASVELWHGTYGDNEVIICQSGIGKVNAAIATTIIAQQHPDLIINTGSAGAVSPERQIGDVVIGEEAVYHDVDATAFGYEIGQVPGMPFAYPSSSKYLPLLKEKLQEFGSHVVVGQVLTSDSFISSADAITAIRKNFPTAQCTEMEGTAIAQVCYQFEIPVLVVRAISDTASNDANVLFDEFIVDAGKQSAEVTLAFIEMLKA